MVARYALRVELKWEETMAAKKTIAGKKRTFSGASTRSDLREAYLKEAIA
jgi:hypothetical protein